MNYRKRWYLTMVIIQILNVPLFLWLDNPYLFVLIIFATEGMKNVIFLSIEERISNLESIIKSKNKQDKVIEKVINKQHHQLRRENLEVTNAREKI